jgi:HK97 family phage major capsid protein
MSKIKELQELRGDAIRRMNSFVDKYPNGEAWEESDKIQYDKDYEFCNTSKGQIESLQRSENAKALIATPADKDVISRGFEADKYKPAPSVSADEANYAFKAWSFYRSGNHHLVSDKMQRSVERCGMNFGDNYWICRTGQTVGTSSQGGYTVQGSLYVGLVEALKAYGGMRSVATVQKTEQGNPLHWATVNDVDNVAAIVSENTAPSSVPLTFGTVVLGSYKYSSQIFPVSLEFSQDSMVDVGSYVGKAIGIRFARAHNAHFTNGSGSGQPTGFLTSATNSVTAAGTTSVTINELINLFHSVDPLYRNNAVFMCSDGTLAILKQIKDTLGRPILLDGYITADGVTRIMGKPVIINNDMPDMTAGLVPIAFGDFSYYVIRDVADVNIRVLDQVLWQSGSLAYVGYSRNDGILTNPSAIKTLTMSAS